MSVARPFGFATAQKYIIAQNQLLCLFLQRIMQEMKTNRIMDEIRETISPEMKMQMELSVAIANRIYEILEEKGMSQKDFARLMGKTETEISRWLSGTHNMTLATLCKISVALGENLLEVPINHKELVVA